MLAAMPPAAGDSAWLGGVEKVKLGVRFPENPIFDQLAPASMIRRGGDIYYSVVVLARRGVLDFEFRFGSRWVLVKQGEP